MLRILDSNKNTKELAKYEEKSSGGRTKKFWKYSPHVVVLADTTLLVEQLAEEIKGCLPDSKKDKVKIITLYSGNMQPKEFGHILVCTPAIMVTLI